MAATGLIEYETVTACSQCGKPARAYLRTACKTCYSAAWRAGTVESIPKKIVRRLERTEKRCGKCHEVKSLSDFNVDNGRGDGRYAYCRACTRAGWHQREKAAPNVSRVRRYGITTADYDRMFAEQGGVCAICRRECARLGSTLSVDHDHASGGVRGLLCGKCNTGIGQFNDNPALLASAIEYLSREARRV